VKRSWRQYVVAMLVLSTAWLCGCASRGTSVVLRPIDGADIKRMEAGRSHTPKVDGWFLSDEYLENILMVDVFQIEK